MSKTIQQNLLLAVFFLFGLFPLLPFSLKPFIIVFAIIVGVYSVIIYKRVSFSRLHFICCILFIMYAVSVFYSNDKAYALKRLETSLSLLILPITFILLSSVRIEDDLKLRLEKLFQLIFYVSSVVFCVLMFSYVYQLGYYFDNVTYDYSMSYIEQDLWGFNEHPIYISIFLSVSLLFSFQLFLYKRIRLFILIGNIILLWSLIFLSRKAILVALFICVLFLINHSLKNVRHRLLIGLFVFFGFGIFYFLQPSSLNRVKEVFTTRTYTAEVNEDNSTNLRFHIYKCAIESIPETGLVGYGIGDVKDVLLDCYKSTSKILVKWNFNTHNQYLNTLLACGFIGLFVFLTILYKLIEHAKNKGDNMFLSILIFYVIIMLTENVLDRQNGVLLFTLIINFYIFKNHLNSNTIHE